MDQKEDWTLEDHFKNLVTEARDLYLSDEVPCVDGPPTPLEFHRDWVCPNRPVIFRRCIDHWPALSKWTPAYLRDKIGDQAVTVAVTPNGMADAVYKDKFVMPEERQMKFSSFLDILEKKENKQTQTVVPLQEEGVFYVQKQNSNLLSEFRDIIDDVETELVWASTALGKQPDAVNFWMGEEKAVTSMHKDHYENLYCVISGQKHFILHPPTDLPYIPYGTYPAARYKVTNGEDFDVMDEPDVGEVPWIPIDPVLPNLERWPKYGNSKPVHCTVHAGDVLYLPSLWFHHVRQEHATIAVNFWYDMEYDIKYNYFKFLEGLVKSNQSASVR
ncbi:bifunctional peptidase and (3S)-lysyl hydroxylase Jmjd7-like [Asterias rubens]|uniref:bifunctional peptidase and (3S)-lysyl hydroxylase Jmjd7-like n=1 Tax=Asterias rubens TaxID=7604 RepID=UPI00145547CA|nr:bifunctional peptidase and (3S)-lysyl hydroxylase Jmjd7-like [Asterias rubens]XP_033633665.1 bifunctional peptidase and (3S)-lysyl hydroxylase Jmjd7-like [Asterias rubens]XP_033633666.1 bifunctional peptidase and (3S)-lysyl hydroxylase Jmjd7-like [Asterias rubens]XP_033633667.1 bifunctional peptidase and (3S)-lysyl hydroxylase Jmjd7-like [Asterias rubens]